MTTPTPLLRAKLAVSAVALATLTGGILGQPAGVPVHAAMPQAAASSTQQIAVRLLAETTDAAAVFGVADSHLYNLGPEDLAARLSELCSLGVTDLRVAVPWVYIEPAAGTYDWSRMDTVVETATAMGFTLTGAVTATPTWAGLPLAGAPNPGTYGGFAGTVAARYGSKIANYEVWNEPNGVLFYAPVSASGYTEMLKAAYTAIKAANPDAVVLAGSLGATTDVRGISVTPQRFLAEMYEAGAAGYFDALSYHPYHFTLPFSGGAGTINAPLDQVRMLYELMVANGDADKQIWATEYGTATTPGWGVTQTEQAALLRDFLTAWSKLSYAGPAFVFTSQDAQSGILNHEYNFGLFTSAGKPKPAAQVLAELIAASGLGELPDYTAPRMSAARDLYLQLASLGFGLANTALIIPNAVVAVVYSLMPEPLKRAFTAVANAVSAAAALVVTAVSPAMEAAIGAALNVGSALAGTRSGAEAADESAEVEGAVGTDEGAEANTAGADTTGTTATETSETDTADSETDSAVEAAGVDEPAAEQLAAEDGVVVDAVEEPATAEETIPDPVVPADETATVTVTVDEPVTDTEATAADTSSGDQPAATDTETLGASTLAGMAPTDSAQSAAVDKPRDEEAAEADTETAATSKRAEKRAEEARTEDGESGDSPRGRRGAAPAARQDQERSVAADRRDDGSSTSRESGRDSAAGNNDSGTGE